MKVKALIPTISLPPLLTKPVLAASDVHCKGKDSINTALGCISTDVQGGGFVKNLLQIGVGIGGTIALILIIYGLFIITTSAGNPDKISTAKEIITSAIGGLLFIIFSTILMNIIGINILGLPGLQ